MALNRYEIDKTKQILENDKELQNTLSNENLILDEDDYIELSKALLENKEQINNHTIEELNQISPPVARNDIMTILDVDYISANLYKQIIYTFKYSTIKIFFRQNYSKFMPDYDFTVINSKPKMKLFIEAFMREYDRFASIIDEIYNLVDVDKTPEKYLNYLAQIVGYEREDSKLLNNVSFRELIKNIVEVYKIKGTNYSFELFFNFLGFNVELKEYWFDKRFGDDNITSNPETGVSNKKLFTFYLTTKKPTENIPSGMRDPYVVAENKLIGTLDVNEFNRKLSQNEYTVKQLLGDESGYSGQHYTFFKTNVMQYSLENIKTEEGEGDELSASDLETIERYANFLTPIFMQKNVTVSIKPFEDDGLIIFPSDADRGDPRSYYARNESMFHYYQGYQPATYYWEDGVKYYNEDILRRFKEGSREDISNPEGGGHFVSGFYTDTTEKFKEIKEDLESEYPHYTESQITEELSNRISNKTIFSNNFPDRDLIPPYSDEKIIFPYRSMTIKDQIIRNVPLEYNYNFSFQKGAKERFSEALNEQLDNRTKILSIVLDDGEGNSIVRINKISTYRYIKANDNLKIMYAKDFKNNGNYTVLETSYTNDYVDITIDGQLNSKQKTSGGFIQIYHEDWKMQDFTFPFMFDRILNKTVSSSRDFMDETFHNFQDFYTKESSTDKIIKQSEYYLINEYSPNYENNIEVTYKMSSPISFNENEEDLKIAGIYETEDGYTRSSYSFYNEYPDFYREYVDVLKT